MSMIGYCTLETKKVNDVKVELLRVYEFGRLIGYAVQAGKEKKRMSRVWGEITDYEPIVYTKQFSKKPAAVRLYNELCSTL